MIPSETCLQKRRNKIFNYLLKLTDSGQLNCIFYVGKDIDYNYSVKIYFYNVSTKEANYFNFSLLLSINKKRLNDLLECVLIILK